MAGSGWGRDVDTAEAGHRRAPARDFRYPARDARMVTTLTPLAQRTDEALMTLWVESRARGAGVQAAFDELYRRHQAAVRGRLMAVLGGREARHLDDLFQDAWLEVARATTFNPGSFKSWVLTVATRKALDRLARHDVKKDAAPEDRDGEPQDPVQSLPAPGATPEARVGAGRLAGILLAALSGAPELQRAAWMLRYVEGLTFEEIAEQEEMPLGTAKTRVRLANETLRRALQARGLDLERLRREHAEGQP